MSILRDEDFYYQYEQNGGTVEMPKEVFWELYNDSKEEIERLKGALQTHEILLKSNVLEIERLNNIINEIEKMFNQEILIKYYYGMSYEFEINDFKDDILKIIKGSDK